MKETLEEALNRLKEKHTILNFYPATLLQNMAEFGAKWQKEQDIKKFSSKMLDTLVEDIKKQQERSYSEEEVHHMIQMYSIESYDIGQNITYDEWFEQFKKK